PFEQRLGLSVTALLLPISEHGVTAVVPHHSGRVKPESPSLLLQPPAHIYVVAGHTELRIEPADGLEARLPERHVAAGDMLGFPVGKEDVYGPTRRVGHAVGDRPVDWWRDVGPADAGMFGGREGRREILEPVGVWVGVVVEVGDDLASGRLHPDVARVTQPAVPGSDQ